MRVLNDGSTIILSSNALSAPEGGDVTFTVTASPAAPVDTPVIVSVSEEMGEGTDRVAREQFLTLVIQAGQTSASQTLTAYSDDDALSDGTLVAWIAAGEGYTLGDPSGVTLPLLDGAAVPEVSVTAGSGVTEGGDAMFTITASPAPAADLAVSVTVSASGDVGVATGQQAVTVPTTGSVTLTVATSDDNTDES